MLDRLPQYSRAPGRAIRPMRCSWELRGITRACATRGPAASRTARKPHTGGGSPHGPRAHRSGPRVGALKLAPVPFSRDGAGRRGEYARPREEPKRPGAGRAAKRRHGWPHGLSQRYLATYSPRAPEPERGMRRPPLPQRGRRAACHICAGRPRSRRIGETRRLSRGDGGGAERPPRRRWRRPRRSRPRRSR